MSDQGLGLDQNIESQPVQTSVEQSIPVQREERLFKQSEVNDIIKKAKLDAVRVAQERPEYAQQKAQSYDNSNQYYQTPAPAHSDDIVRRIAAEEAQRLRDQWVEENQRSNNEQHAQKIVQDFFTKLSTGKDKYSDFDETVGDVDFGKFPNVVQLLTNYIDNTDDVMYSLGSDRIKLANLEQLAYMSPNDAKKAVQRLSKSIKDNQEAGKMRNPKEPLSHLRPTTSGTDAGVLTVSDYRKKYRG